MVSGGCGWYTYTAWRRKKPLFLAAERDKDCVESLDWLIGKKADVNARDSQERTPLIVAAQSHNNLKVFEPLLAAKADVTATDMVAYAAADYAREYRDNTVYLLLEQVKNS